jgi:hypothetical protein
VLRIKFFGDGCHENQRLEDIANVIEFIAEHLLSWPIIFNMISNYVILTTCEADAENALADVRTWMASHQLELHPDKIRLHIRRSQGLE